MPKTSERSTGSACSQPIVCKVRQRWAAKIALWPILRWSRTAMRQSGSIVWAAPELRHSAATAASAASASHASIARVNSSRARCGLGNRHSSTGPSTQSPSLTSCACDALKLSSAQKSGKQPLAHGRGLPEHVRRVDHHHRVELEPDRPRLDVANARQEQAGQQLSVREPLLELGDRDLERPVARGLLEPAHDRLDLRAKLAPSRV